MAKEALRTQHLHSSKQELEMALQLQKFLQQLLQTTNQAPKEVQLDG